jgi:hypothetical protein
MNRNNDRLTRNGSGDQVAFFGKALPGDFHFHPFFKISINSDHYIGLAIARVIQAFNPQGRI